MLSVRFVTSTALALSLTGCMTFNQSLIKVPDVAALPTPVTVEIKQGALTQTLNGEGDHRGVLDNSNIAKQTAKVILSRWKDKGLVSEYGTAGELNGDPQFAFTLTGNRNEDGSILGAVVSGLTLMLIPNTSTITNDLQVDLENKKTGIHYLSKAKNAFSSTTQLFFFPAFAFGPMGALHSNQDIADALAADLIKQGAFGH